MNNVESNLPLPVPQHQAGAEELRPDWPVCDRRAGGDCGMTGRNIIVETYGGAARYCGADGLGAPKAAPVPA